MGKNVLRNTSANIDAAFVRHIAAISNQFQRSGSEIFKDIINLTINQIKCGLVSGLLTEYQDHNPEKWEIIYYSLDAEEIELFSSARQKYKISVSKLAFIGFLLFWKLLLFIYKKKYLKKIQISLNSYTKYQEKLQNYIEYFHKRLKFVKKE